MKKCPRCGEVKPLTKFHRRTKSADGRQAYCKQCRKTNKDYAGPRRKRYMSFIKNFRGCVCQVCTSKVEVIELHHVNPKSKKFDIGKSENYLRSAKEILEELKKVVRVCVFCHMAIHNDLIAYQHLGGSSNGSYENLVGQAVSHQPEGQEEGAF